MSDVETRDHDPEWATAPRDRWRRLRGRSRWLVVLAVAVLVGAGTAGGFWAHSALAGPQAEVGDLLSDSTAEGLIHSASVRLPWGTLDISAGDASEHVPDTVLYSRTFDAGYDEIDPPDDGSWVPLKIEPDISFGDVLFRSRADATIPATTLSVVSGGRTIPLARAAGGGKQSTGQVLSAQLAPAFGGYLALPDRPDDLHLRVEFAGVRQDVYVNSGRIVSRQAAPLYRSTADDVKAECSKGAVPGYRLGYTIEGSCTMSRLLHLPYVAGLGWARTGRTWLVTTVRTLPPHQLFRTSASGARTTYYTDEDVDATSTLRYGTVAARSHAAFNEVNSSIFQDPDRPDQFVFDVPATDRGTAGFTLATRFAAEPSDTDSSSPTGPVELTVTRTIRPRVS